MHRNETLTPHINGSTIACRYNQIIQLKIFRLQKYWSNHLEGFRHLTMRIFKIVEDTFPMAFHGSAQLGYKTWLMDGRFANACFQRKKAIFTSLSKSRFFSWVTCSGKFLGRKTRSRSFASFMRKSRDCVLWILLWIVSIFISNIFMGFRKIFILKREFYLKMW